MVTWYILSKNGSIVHAHNHHSRSGVLPTHFRPDDVAVLRDCCLAVADEAEDQFGTHGFVQLSTKKWPQAFGQLETVQEAVQQPNGGVIPDRGA